MFGAILGSIAGPVIGGLLGGKGSSQQQTQQQQLDPRMQGLLYGGNGRNGLLNDTQNLYERQFAQGGLNPMQNAGLEMQRQYLMSPQYSRGYQSMYDTGMGLLGGGVAGNPFTQRPMQMPQQMPAPGGMGGGMGGGFSYQQNPALQGAGALTAMQPEAMPQAKAPTIEEILAEIERRRMASQTLDYSGGPGNGSE